MSEATNSVADEVTDEGVVAGVRLLDVTEVPWRDLVTPGTALWHSLEKRDRPVPPRTPSSTFANFAPPDQ